MLIENTSRILKKMQSTNNDFRFLWRTLYEHQIVWCSN